MSDTIEKTPQQLAKEKTESRVNELKALAGKTFVRKDGWGHPIKIDGYAGTAVKDGVSMHLLQAETVGARWTPPATEFLASHDEVETPATATEGTI